MRLRRPPPERTPLAFAAPPTLRTGPLEDAVLARVAAGPRGAGATTWSPTQWVDNGPGWLALELASAEAVLALEPDLAAGPGPQDRRPRRPPGRAPAALGGAGVRARPRLGEDPVTGSLHASLAQWLLREGRAPRRYRAGQGTRVGRAGVVEVEQADDGTVWVGGATTTLVRGVVTL